MPGKNKSEFDVRELTDREKLSRFVSQKIAESLPPEFVSNCVEEAIRTYITNFKVEEYEVRAVMRDVILARTKELLRERYATQVDAEADRLAQQALANTRR